jgi:hypothetical protein
MLARVGFRFREIDLSGTAEEFIDFGRLVASGAGEIVLPDADPGAFDLTIHRISVVTVDYDTVLIDFNPDLDIIEIVGPLDALTALGENLGGMAEATPPYHTHIEHPNYSYIGEGSAPLIASLK